MVWTLNYIIALMMRTEMFPETMVVFNGLIQLITREDFISTSGYGCDGIF
jgi:hypothetical protein